MLLLIARELPVPSSCIRAKLVRPLPTLLTGKLSLRRVIAAVALLTGPKILTLTLHLSWILPLVEVAAAVAPLHAEPMAAGIGLVVLAAAVSAGQVSVPKEALLTVDAPLAGVLLAQREGLLVHALVPLTHCTKLVVTALLPWHLLTLHLTLHLVISLAHEVLSPWKLALVHVAAHRKVALLWKSLVAHPLVAKGTLVTLKTLVHTCTKRR